MRRTRTPDAPGQAPAIGWDEIVFAVALVLITVGLWPCLGVTALVAPGAALLWLSLPSRAHFLLSAPPRDRKEPPR